MTLTAEKVVRRVRTAVENVAATSPAFNSLLNDLRGLGDCAIVGGAVRDWSCRRSPRDLDLVVDAPPDKLAALVWSHAPGSTGMGGFRVKIDSFACDVWSLGETWAIRSNSLPKSIESLTDTAFFNVDAVAVDVNRWRVYGAGFFNAWNRRVLEVNYAPNPRPAVCTARAFSLALKYRLKLSGRLVGYVAKQMSSRAGWNDVVSEFERRYSWRLTMSHVRQVLLDADGGDAALEKFDPLLESTMADRFDEARTRAKETLLSQWQELARTRTLGWAGPVEIVAEQYPFIRNSVATLANRVVRELPLFIFQSRESQPSNMEVAVPYRDARGNPFNSRIISSVPLSPDQVLLRSEIAQAIWFLLDQKILPSPSRRRAFRDALLQWTGTELFEL